MATFSEIVSEVNRLAVDYEIGQLHSLRKSINGKRKRFSEVFWPARPKNYTYHKGGRTELQFNLGIVEPFPEVHGDLRYGVAFSFETDQSVPSIEPLRPKVEWFNEHLGKFAHEFSGFWMWDEVELRGKRSDLRRPEPIDRKLVEKGVFVFIGGIGDSAAPDYRAILNTFDQFVPLYRSIEQNVPCG